MHKQNSILIPFLAIGVVLILGYKGFGLENSLISTDLFHFTSPWQSQEQNDIKGEAWTMFQNYLEFTRTHNLSGIRSLSHQISATCNDSLKEKECFALMDSVYAIARLFELSDFKYIQSDERQIVMYTDGPTVAILYFTRNETGVLKVLGMRFCLEDESTIGTCIKTDVLKLDQNQNGWWDSVESLFY